MNKKPLGMALVAALVSLVSTATASVRDLTFEDRVRAQEAIERVYYSHQIGATQPFEVAVPRSVLEKKVRTYLDQSAALEDVRHTPVTQEMLDREVQRMERGSRMPERLAELYAALGNDPLWIQECLARATLVDRLARDFAAGPQDEDRRAEAAPAGRAGHQAVWTGSSMIVWGAWHDSTGGRYDPVADTWLPTSTTGAPETRGAFPAVWTGSVMIVWGGLANSTFVNTGGRYNPATDSWTPTSTVGAPTGRYYHSAVWTGSRMIVWGGNDGSGFMLNTGGRYDPVTDTWTPTSTVGAPSPRETHTAVWTGSRMIVWGGHEGGPYADTGGRYDPATDTWTPTSTLGVTNARWEHTAVWTGSLMLVWGGRGVVAPGVTDYLNTGGKYDPATDTWLPMSITKAPEKRTNHTAVWSGNAMIVWGGWANGSNMRTGSRYDPVKNKWMKITNVGSPSKRSLHTAVWTGSLMVVWGGVPALNTGGRYNPVTNVWTPTSTFD